MSLADVELGFEEKVYAHFAAAQAALPFLNPTGSLTFVSAVCAQAAAPGTAGIGAANAAIAAIVPILAVELKPLRVNGVSPGRDRHALVGPYLRNRSSDVRRYGAKTPVGRVGQPEDVAQAIAFLIGNGFITGHMLVCDGGLRSRLEARDQAGGPRPVVQSLRSPFPSHTAGNTAPGYCLLGLDREGADPAADSAQVQRPSPRVGCAPLGWRHHHALLGDQMPYVNVQITTGATYQQKAELVKDITNSLVRVLGKKLEHTHIVIQEIAEENWGFSGLLTDEWKKSK